MPDLYFCRNSVEFLNLSCSLEPENVDVLYNRALLNSKIGNIKNARDDYGRIVDLLNEKNKEDAISVNELALLAKCNKMRSMLN